MTCENSWITAISYNTPDYLEIKLNELVNCHKIEFWCFIQHKKEEMDLKDHIHLTMVCNGRFDSMEFTEFTKEPDLKNKIPLKTINYQKMCGCSASNLLELRNGDLLYNKHDPTYLKTKGEKRKIHYNWEDFRYSDKDYWEYYISQITIPKSKFQEIEDTVIRNESPVNLLRKGVFGIRDYGHLLKVEAGILQEKEHIRHDHDRFECKICGKIKSVDELDPHNSELQTRLDHVYSLGTCAVCARKEL